MKVNNSITAIPGLLVGHAHDQSALTGCTVVLCEGGAVGGVDQRGGAPGTRETDALRPMHLVEQVHAVLLSGGSAFGLEAAAGVMRFLEERGAGFDVGVARVPIVPAAILFDLGLGRADVRPGAEMGYQACLNASEDPPAEGCVGAGAGATLGKILGMNQAMKSGIGCALQSTAGGLLVGAIMAVNSLGDVIDPSTGRIVAGARSVAPGGISAATQALFADTFEVMKNMPVRSVGEVDNFGNTAIGVVATNARLTKEQANLVAQMAQDGVARAIRPSHTLWDGDTLFCLATGERSAEVNLVGACAAEAVSQAILRAVRQARSAGGLPALQDLVDPGTEVT